MYKCIGLVDADLLDNGTRHPNLTLLKIAGLLYDNNILFELILDKNVDISRYTTIYMSRVFTFTKLPELYTRAIGTPDEKKVPLWWHRLLCKYQQCKRIFKKAGR